MARYADIYLAGIEPPPIIEALSFETIRADLLTDAAARLNAAGIPFDVTAIEADPVVMLCEAYAYRELQLRARINDALKAVLLATSYGGNLDHLGAFYATERQEGETDERFKRRIQLAPESLSTAGPAGAYQYHVLTFAPWARDVSAISPRPGTVRVTVLASGANPTPTAEQLSAIYAYLTSEPIRPLTDMVQVLGPRVRHVTVNARLTLYPGPQASVVREKALAAVTEWLNANRMLGMNLRRSALMSRLHQDGVHSVELVSPAADLVLDPTEVYALDAVKVSVTELRDE